MVRLSILFTFFLIVSFCAIWGFALPMLFSAKDTFDVLAGIGIILAIIVVLTLVFVPRLQDHINHKNTGE